MKLSNSESIQIGLSGTVRSDLCIRMCMWDVKSGYLLHRDEATSGTAAIPGLFSRVFPCCSSLWLPKPGFHGPGFEQN